ncbi:FAD-dependent thymidylate synthase [Candidatus Woesearchaeota archaeon]|nr:FAD-dependent thymidylate synthase [Candidatus Woesearchaeota archaeon]
MEKRRIYTLNDIPQEVKAVAFAKCSRSPEPFDKIAAELNADKSRKFHERWVVGYGHSSVAEHAVLSLAIENVSILATKVIEDCRLASFTEKSTRYQVFDKDHYYKPKKIMDSRFRKLYEESSDFIMETYSRLFPKMLEFFKKKFPEKKDIEIKNMACDVMRYFLPVSSLTNLGMTINARSLEWAIVKLLTHPLKEMQEIGEEIKEAALKVTPTLIKYTKYSEYLGNTLKDMEKEAYGHIGGYKKEERSGKISEEEKNVELVSYDKEAEDKLVTSLLYRFSDSPYKDIKEKVRSMSQDEKEALIGKSLKRLGKFDKPLRELEHISYTFDILMDYGSFRDIQRHRMAVQTNQEFTVRNGYSTPQEIKEAGLEKEYDGCMKKAEKAFDELSEDIPREAQYVIPLAYKKRLLMTMSLRELFYFIRLRSGKMGHLSYRKIAWQMYNLVKEKHPSFAGYIECDMS